MQTYTGEAQFVRINSMKVIYLFIWILHIFWLNISQLKESFCERENAAKEFDAQGFKTLFRVIIELPACGVCHFELKKK